VAQLIVRNIDEEIVRALRRRAVEHGRSAEAEHRLILEEALVARSEGSLKDLLLAIPSVGTDRDFARDRGRGRRVAL
jgi:plasmid stability protein